jgi:hypothetical protein
MHRSGTSMVARLLHEAGLHLGSGDDLMPAADENPEGFYEHLGFVRLNDEVLNAAGAGWDCPPVDGFDWLAPELEPFRERARNLAKPLQRAGAWGWKDPRTSLTIPFWRAALGPLRAVFVVRNPLEVVTSLHRRNGFSTALALTLWRIYAERFLAATTPEDRLVTHFDTYFMAPEPEIERLLAFAGLTPAQETSALREAAVPALRHHRKTLRDLSEHGFSAEVIDLYRRLSREAGWQEDAEEESEIEAAPAVYGRGTAAIARGTGGVDLLRVENEALRRNNADFTAALADREARVGQLESALHMHEAARSELEGKLVERDGKVAEREAMLARRDQAIAILRQQREQDAAKLNQLRAENAALAERLAESERARTISEIYERDLRSMLTGLHSIQLQRDAEIMGTLGAVLSRHAPGAPASIYHRRLVDQVRRLAEAHIPPGARTLVATYGDPALLMLGDRPTVPFPRSPDGVAADYTDVSGDEAVAQLEALRDDGAEYLVVPSPALPWLIGHPELDRHLEERYSAVIRDRGVATIFSFGRERGQIPA